MFQPGKKKKDVYSMRPPMVLLALCSASMKALHFCLVIHCAFPEPPKTMGFRWCLQLEHPRGKLVLKHVAHLPYCLIPVYSKVIHSSSALLISTVDGNCSARWQKTWALKCKQIINVLFRSTTQKAVFEKWRMELLQGRCATSKLETQFLLAID